MSRINICFNHIKSSLLILHDSKEFIYLFAVYLTAMIKSIYCLFFSIISRFKNKNKIKFSTSHLYPF